MTTPEGKIEKHLKKEVEASGGKVRKLKWIGKSGAPDRLIWWPQAEPHTPLRMAFVELKAPGKKPTKVQELEHTALRQDGFAVFVVDSVDEANNVIAKVRGGSSVMATQAPVTRRWLPYSKADFSHIDVKSPPDLPSATPQALLKVENYVKVIVPDNSDLI